MQNQMKCTTAALWHSSPAEAALRPGGATVLSRVLTAKPAFSQGQMYTFQAQGRSLRKRWLLRGKDTSRARKSLRAGEQTQRFTCQDPRKKKEWETEAMLCWIPLWTGEEFWGCAGHMGSFCVNGHVLFIYQGVITQISLWKFAFVPLFALYISIKRLRKKNFILVQNPWLLHISKTWDLDTNQTS